MNKGKLYLIPNSLGNDDLALTVPRLVFDTVNICDVYIVENIKSAAKFLKLAGIKKPLKELTFYVLNVNTNPVETSAYLEEISGGKNIGLISEAGLPCIADPGNVIVRMAHQQNITVVPLSGPSSITMALMASGLNGQNFAFNGYLPIEKHQRLKKLKELEKKALVEDQSQIFIEAPHRNQKLFDDITAICSSDTMLSVSVNLTTGGEFIKTSSISDWKTRRPALGKNPVIFIIGK